MSVSVYNAVITVNRSPAFNLRKVDIIGDIDVDAGVRIAFCSCNLRGGVDCSYCRLKLFGISNIEGVAVEVEVCY